MSEPTVCPTCNQMLAALKACVSAKLSAYGCYSLTGDLRDQAIKAILAADPEAELPPPSTMLIRTVAGCTANTRQWQPGDIVLDAEKPKTAEHLLKVLKVSASGYCTTSALHTRLIGCIPNESLLDPSDFGIAIPDPSMKGGESN